MKQPGWISSSLLSLSSRDSGGWGGRGRVGIVIGALAVGALMLWSPPAVARCYIAFVHGSGESHHDERSGEESTAIERYWRLDDRADTSFVDATARAAGDCVVWRVGYDGHQQWWNVRAAGRVAAALHDFIDTHAIPDGGLTLIGHSMGGLVVRYVVNNGMPGSPFYNEYIAQDERMDYDLVRRKTGRLIAVQSPNTGTQSADALYGEADHAVTNSGASVIKILGWRDTTNAVATMTRPYMEAAGAPGGEMGDDGRTIPLYTVAGIDTGEASGTGTDNDGKLDTAWVLLCYKRGAANSWGAACRWDPWNFESIPGDGLVEHQSAHGGWMRGRPTGTPAILGARRPWLDVVHNHNHTRYDALSASIRNHLDGSTTVARFGTYVGRSLP